MSPPRKRVWARSDFVEEVVQTAADEPARFEPLAAFESQYGAQLLGCTIARVRGRLLLRATGDEGSAIAYAAMRVAQDSDLNDPPEVDEGPASTPGRHSDWMFWQPLMLPGAGASSALAAHFDGANWVDIDVKAMRKIDELNQTLALYTHVSSDVGYNYTVQVSLSCLVLLP